MPTALFRRAARCPLTCLFACGLVAISGNSEPLSGQDLSSNTRSTPSPRSVPAAEIVHGRVDDITVDGDLIEDRWQDVQPLTGFVQREPVEGVHAEEQTEIRMLFDEEALYIAARMYDSEPETIVRRMVRRDEQGQYDFIEVGLDPNLDRRTGYIFRVSAANVQRDEYLFDDRERDDAWDAVWESAVKLDADGWTVEMRIPLSQIRYEQSDEPRPWGVNFNRQRVRTNEISQYKLISRTQRGIVSQFATLDDVQVLGSSRRIEVRPYALSSAYRGPADGSNPFQDGSEASARIGADVRYGIGSQFTLDATINPDFGQVESDPAVINLTALETFLQERRPFFVEDARVLDFSLSGGRNKLYYSRRMGRRPQGRPPGGATATDIPDAATILGAVKLTGRTSGGLSIGALSAVTQGETGTAFFGDDDAYQSFLAEPRAEYGVVRLRQDFNDGASTFGGIVTTMHRELPDDGSFDFLTRNAFSVGVDWEHQWADRSWAFVGYVAASHVRGDSVAMIGLQRRSNHYFQRPDSRWLSLDSTATTMSGVDWRMTLDRRRGEHWTGSIWAAQVTSGFEVNDLGFTGRQEVLDGGARVSYREIQPGSVFQSYGFNFFTFHNWSHDALRDAFAWDSWGRAHVSGSANLRADGQLTNFWRINGNVTVRPETSDRSATRGGPLMASPRSIEGRFGLESDQRRAVSLGAGGSIERGAQDSESRLSLGLGMELRPSSRVEVKIDPKWSTSASAAQYVTATSDDAFTPTYGRRYLFADLERTELSVETRLNVSFTPELSLQLFAQPLLSSGDYVAYKQFLAPETFSFDTFDEGTFTSVGAEARCAAGRTCVDGENTRYVDFDGDGAPDTSFADKSFNVRSLVGNAVLRWEYRPGSTVFLVWQRRQADRVAAGDFEFRRDLDGLLNAPAENIFMVKVNYWMGI